MASSPVEPGTGSPFTTLPPPGTVTYTPDYASLIQNDPAFVALQNSLSGQGIQDAAQRQAATEQALIGYGAIPDFSSAASSLGLSPDALAMLQSDIDPNAASLAQSNTQSGLSTTAQLAQQQTHALQTLRNNLAARGALSSGDDAYNTNLQNQSYAAAQQSALNSLLAAINGYQQTYLNSHNAETGQLNAGMTTAEQFEASLPQNQGFTLTYDAKSGTYKDPAGDTYTVTSNSDGTYILTNSALGVSYKLGPGGVLTPYTPPASTGGTGTPGTGTPGGPVSSTPWPATGGGIFTGPGAGGRNPASGFGGPSTIYTGPGAGGRGPGTFTGGPINTGFGHVPGSFPGVQPPINVDFGHVPDLASLHPAPLGTPPHLAARSPFSGALKPPPLPTPAI